MDVGDGDVTTDECIAPPGAVMSGRLRLPPETPLSRFGRLRGKAASDLVRGLGAVTVGDLLRATARDIHRTGSPVYLSTTLIRRTLAPWMDDGSGGDLEPILIEPFDEAFDATPLSDLDLSGPAIEVLAPLDRIADLRLHPVSVLAKGCGFGRGDLARLRATLSGAYASTRPRGAPVPAPDGVGVVDGRQAVPFQVPRPPRYDFNTPVLDHVTSRLAGATARERSAAMDWLVRYGCGRSTRWDPVDENDRAARKRAFARIEADTRMMEVLGEELGRLAASTPFPYEEILAASWCAGLPESTVSALMVRCAGLRPLSLGGIRVVVPVALGDWKLRLRDLQTLACQAHPDETTHVVASRFGNGEGGVIGGCLSRLALMVMGDGDAFVALTRLGLWRQARLVALGSPNDGVAIEDVRRRLSDLDADDMQAGPRIDPRHPERFAALRAAITERIMQSEMQERMGLARDSAVASRLARRAQREAKAAERREAKAAGTLAAFELRQRNREDRTARWLTGLAEEAAERERIAGLCEGLMRRLGPQLRWRVSTLAEMLASEADGGHCPDEASVAGALAAGAAFQTFGRSWWGLLDGGSEPEGTPEMRVSEALARYGQPLSTGALAGLARMGSRGTGGYIPNPTGKVLELREGFWGLAERDYRPEPKARNRLAKALRRRFSAGVDNVGALLAANIEECREAGVHDVAGLRTFLGRELGLSTNAMRRVHEKGVVSSPRRCRIEAEFARRLAAPPGRLSFGEAVRIACATLGGTAHHTVVSDALQAVAELGRDGLWRKRRTTGKRSHANAARVDDAGKADWWTPEREALLRALFDAGMPSDQVKAAMGRFGQWS